MIEFFEEYGEARKWADMHRGELVVYPSEDYEYYMKMVRGLFDEEFAKEYPYAVYYMLGFEWLDDDEDE